MEAALARAAAGLGLVPTTAADAVTAACADPARLDLATVVAKAADAGNPVPPLVRVLQDAVGERDAVAVHVGATSQDVLDTALMLLARNAIAEIDADLVAAAAAAARLAEGHRDDVVMGRTLMQQALPTTFGLKAAGWLSGIEGARLRLAEVVASLPVQYGGAAGTLAASGGSGIALRAALAAELDLAVTAAPWHTVRLPIADLAGALGDGGRRGRHRGGGRRPARADRGGRGGGGQREPGWLLGDAAQGQPGRGDLRPGLRAPGPRTGGDAVRGDGAGARARGRRLAQRVADPDRLLTTVGSAASWLAESLASLRIDAARMAAAVAAGGQGQLAHAVAEALTPSLGAGAAHDAAADAVQQARETGRPLADVLAGRPGLDVAALLEAAAPDVGEAAAQTDAVLAEHRRLTEGTP